MISAANLPRAIAQVLAAGKRSNAPEDDLSEIDNMSPGDLERLMYHFATEDPMPPED